MAGTTAVFGHKKGRATNEPLLGQEKIKVSESVFPGIAAQRSGGE
jgi:hypothetical protein